MTTPDYRRRIPKRARGVVDYVPLACISGKHSWLSRQRAVQGARAAGGRYGQPFGVYRCRDCRQYHLTSQVDR